MYDMFYGCTSLTSVNLSNFITTKVSSMDGLFYNCPKLQYIDISKFTTNLESVPILGKLPSSGKIFVKSDFYNKIKSQIPSNWEITFK